LVQEGSPEDSSALKEESLVKEGRGLQSLVWHYSEACRDSSDSRHLEEVSVEVGIGTSRQKAPT
jgi:hypothetical protein